MTGMSPMNGIVFLVAGLVRPDQAGEEVRLAVLQADVRRDRARADDRLRLAADVTSRSELRDLDVELQRDLLVVVHARLDLDLDADVLVLERGDAARCCRRPSCRVLKVVVGIGTLSPITSCAFWPSEIRSCGLASSSASVLFLMKLSVADGMVKPNELMLICLSWPQVKLPSADRRRPGWSCPSRAPGSPRRPSTASSRISPRSAPCWC